MSATMDDYKQQRDELSDEMERCHRLLDAHYGEGLDTVTLDTLEDRLRTLLSHPEQINETAVHVFPSSCPKAVLDSADLATEIWDYCESVRWGRGKAMLALMDFKSIIDKWLRDKRGHQFEWVRRDYPAAGQHVCKFCGTVAPVETAS